MSIGFDHDKYTAMQSEHIRNRIAQFGGKLYLELGGKLFDDNHASRVLPGFKPDSKVHAESYALVVDGTCIEQVTQISATLLCPEDAVALRDACAKVFGDHIKGKMPTIQSIDFNRADVNKAEGIRRLLELRGIDPEIILTVGDGENDLAMLEALDFCGYAMQNSMPVVVERVSRTTESVAALIEEYL